MLNNREEIDVLILSYLNGEAGPEEAIQLEDWRRISSENERHFLELEKTHAATYGYSAYTQSSKGSAWKVIENEIVPKSKVIPLWRNPLFITAIAAAIIAVVVVTRFYRSENAPSIAVTPETSITPDQKERENVIYAATNVAYYTLKDDSKVTLQPGSKLTIPKDFNHENRSLDLDGSGTFEVVHDDANPFILSVGDLKIIDLGTIFHVDNQGDTVKVLVEEGIVELDINGNTMIVEEGDSAFYLVSEKLIKAYPTSEARKDVVFDFDGTSLAEVSKILSDFFHRKIVIINPALKGCSVSVRFKNEELVTILSIIAELLDVSIVQNQKTIEIHGESCQ